MRWWRRASLRARLTLLAIGGLTAGLAVGGAVLVAVVEVTLQRSVDAEADQTGEDVARLVTAGALPVPMPVTGEQLVQVVDNEHRVLAASINADRLVPLLREAELDQLRDGGRTVVRGDRIGASSPVRVVAVPAGEATVLVAKPMTDLRRSVAVVRTILLVAFPPLVGVLAMVMWRVVGAALRPVEALRVGAAEITEAGRPASLPVPASHDEVHRLAVTLNDMLARLDRARARQRAFVADAAHELRSPLANMRTELEVAQRLAGMPGRDSQWPRLAEDLLADTRRLASLVDDLLLLARADDARPRQWVVEPVELSSLLREVAQRYPRPPAAVADSPPLWTEGEPEALRRVVANLLDNAVRHARSQVRLAVEPDGEQLLLTVCDDGPGIAAVDRERVFDRFTRLDDARGRDAGGAGLGLAIVRELVRQHGGVVTLTGVEPGPGLRAEVRLPALPAPAALTAPPASGSRSAEPRASDRQSSMGS